MSSTATSPPASPSRSAAESTIRETPTSARNKDHAMKPTGSTPSGGPANTGKRGSKSVTCKPTMSYHTSTAVGCCTIWTLDTSSDPARSPGSEVKISFTKISAAGPDCGCRSHGNTPLVERDSSLFIPSRVCFPEPTDGANSESRRLASRFHRSGW